MFGIGPLELIAIAVLALILLGPERFPELARGAGKAMGEFWSMRDEVTREIMLSLEEPAVSKVPTPADGAGTAESRIADQPAGAAEPAPDADTRAA